MTNLTAQLAQFAAELEWEQAPARVQDVIRTSFNDTLAVALAGSSTAEFRALHSLEQPGNLGEGGLADAAACAMLLGTAVHALDYDDIHLPMGGHPSAVVIGAVLAASAVHGAGPSQTLSGFLAGMETAARIGRAISAGHYHVGWHPTSVIGALAAATGAARVLGLDPRETQRALGLATAMAAGTKANFGTFTKPLQVGHASRVGLMAATYAGAGLTASESILDSQHGGFTELYTESVDESALVDGLGTDFSIMKPPPVIKLIPACGGVHAATWAAIALAKEHNIAGEEVASITAEVHPKRIPHTNRPVVRSGLEGKFSTQYCLAVAITQREVTLADFTDDSIQEPARQTVLRRASLVAAPDADEWPGGAEYSTGARGARVTVELTDGTVHQQFLGAAPGYPGNPADQQQLRGKFMDCAGRAASPAEADAWYRMLGSDDSTALRAAQEIVSRVVLG